LLQYLTQRFSRITIDFAHMDGRACIRGLPITVSDVAKLAVSGKSAAEIIAVYPDLDADDVHQALAYGICEIEQVIGIHRNDALSKLALIEGYANLLIDSRDSTTDEEKQSYADVILKSTYHGMTPWWYLSSWVDLLVGRYHYSWGVSEIAEILSNTTRRLKQYEPEVTVNISLPDVLSTTKCSNIESAFIYLLSERIGINIKAEAQLVVTLKNHEQLQINIQRPFGYKHENVHVNNLLYEGSPTALAAYIIRKHGSQLRTHISDTHITFEFDLPIWKENESDL